jgi:hypothetical protein
MPLGDPTLTREELPGGAEPAFTHPGQAHFANRTSGLTCADCCHHVARSDRSRGLFCLKAKEFAGRWLPAVPPSASACKYLQRRTP